MKGVAVNVDVGEGEFGCEIDLAFLSYVDAVNIALGAHAGSPEWSVELAKMALTEGVNVNLHPGYPDRVNFGRKALEITIPDLMDSLSEQRAVLPGVSSCKFHGALYNRAMVDEALASLLVEWMLKEGVDQVVAMPNSQLAKKAQVSGLKVVREGFLDRAYLEVDGQLVLAPREQEGAVLHEVEQMVAQYLQISQLSQVTLWDGHTRTLECESLCLHGDGVVGLEAVKQIRQWRLSS